MAEFIPSKQWSQIRQLSAQELRKLAAIQIEDEENDPIGVFVLLAALEPSIRANIRTRAEYLAQTANSVMSRETMEFTQNLYVAEKAPVIKVTKRGRKARK